MNPFSAGQRYSSAADEQFRRPYSNHSDALLGHENQNENTLKTRNFLDLNASALPVFDSVQSYHSLKGALHLLEENIKTLQTLVPAMAQSTMAPVNAHHASFLQQQQVAASAGVASVISQLAVAAAGVLPTISAAMASSPNPEQSVPFPDPVISRQDLTSPLFPLPVEKAKESRKEQQNFLPQELQWNDFGAQIMPSKAKVVSGRKADLVLGEDPSEKDFDIVEVDPCEILAEHSHFCEICGKGFKRDANLRMHMRGHGDQYKTLEALAKPAKSAKNAATYRPRRFSCPSEGCKRNKAHKKFTPLKTMLCVKNHYRRTHCAKILVCSKCKEKKFAVVADLKTHEKHCGKEKWMCSCGTSFSRKDKLLGHLNLFAGHTPASGPEGETAGILGLGAAAFQGGGFQNGPQTITQTPSQTFSNGSLFTFGGTESSMNFNL